MTTMTVLFDDGTRFGDGTAWIDDSALAALLFDDGTRFGDGTSWKDN